MRAAGGMKAAALANEPGGTKRLAWPKPATPFTGSTRATLTGTAAP